MGARRLIGVTVAAAIIAAAWSPQPAAAASAATLAVTTRPIVALAAGGGRVAFRTAVHDLFGNVCNGVHVVSGAGGRVRLVAGCAPVRDDGGVPVVPQLRGTGVAVSRRVVAYDTVVIEPVNATHDEASSRIWRAGPGRVRSLAHGSYEITCSGNALGRFAYAGGVAYTTTTETEVDPAMECEGGSGGGSGVSTMTAAGLRFVPAGSASSTAIAGAPGAARIAGHGATLAVVPLALPQDMGGRITPPTAGTAEVQSWNTATATRSCSAPLAAEPVALATNGRQIDALVQVAGVTHLVRVSAATCARLGDRALGAGVRAQLAVGGGWAVWATSRKITGLDLATGRVRTLRAVAGPAHGLAIDGGNLVWWITGPAHSRVLRMALP
jgi:hypothetical protein